VQQQRGSTLPVLAAEVWQLAAVAARDQRDARLEDLTTTSASLARHVFSAASAQASAGTEEHAAEILSLLLTCLEALARDCQQLNALVGRNP
jgi:hypothetical protein